MTAPRPFLPGTAYLVTRRCTRREFLLRPSGATNELFLFVLARAALLYGICVHAFCVMSNHYHLVVTDPDARLPSFTQYLDALVARAMNAALGRSENFWATEECSVVELVTAADVVDKTAYVLANPVAAGLVRDAREWPGAWSAPEQLGTQVALPRPKAFFRADGDVPAEVDLELSVPPGFASVDDFRRRVVEACAAREEGARRERRSSGRGFLGAAKVLAQKPWARPTRRAEPLGQLNPRVAARDPSKRTEALARLKAFVASYRRAWAAWRAGVRDTVFPPGTYLLRVTHRVRCEALC
jgi:REP element-mobilizing transposase RayT